MMFGPSLDDAAKTCRLANALSRKIARESSQPRQCRAVDVQRIEVSSAGSVHLVDDGLGLLVPSGHSSLQEPSLLCAEQHAIELNRTSC